MRSPAVCAAPGWVMTIVRPPSRSVSLPVTGRSGMSANSNPRIASSPTTRTQSATRASGPASLASIRRVRMRDDLGSGAPEDDGAEV